MAWWVGRVAERARTGLLGADPAEFVAPGGKKVVKNKNEIKIYVCIRIKST